MSQNHMTRWIEIADERHFFEDAKGNQMQQASESQFLDLGVTILKIPSWFPRGVHRRKLPVSADVTPTG
jgi:hypothetical protein